MKTHSSTLTRLVSSILSLFFILGTFSLLHAQEAKEDICKDGDCSPEIFSIQLSGPLTAAPSSQRTEQFKTAYKRFKQIKEGYLQKPGWKDKYDAFQLGGQSCVRFYQLEGQFAYEYEKNPDFKKFIDATESDPEAFKKTGFMSSRRGLNLTKRMDINCPREVKKVEDKPGPRVADMPSVYMKLGQVQGYFDSEGKLLKPLEQPVTTAPSSEADKSKMSKKEQIAQLKNKTSNLPIGPGMVSNLGGIGSALSAARPKVGALSGLLGALKPRFAGLLTKPVGLLSKLSKLKGLLGGLKNFIPKVPNPGLSAKIGDLLKRGDDLRKRVKDAEDKGEKLKKQFEDLTQKVADKNKEIDEGESQIKKLQDALGALQNRQSDLLNRLEDRPKKYLEELTKLANDLGQDADDLVKKTDKAKKFKDKLLEELDKLHNEKDKVSDKLKKLEDLLENLGKEGDELEKEAQQAAEEVEEIKEKEKALENLQQKLDDLVADKKWKEEILLCEEDLAKLLLQIKPVEEAQNKIKGKLAGLKELPGKIMDKLSNLKIFQKKLKLGKNGIPVVGKTLKKLDGLIEKGEAIGGVVEILTGKKSKLQEKVEGFGDQLEEIKGDYESKVEQVAGIKKDLLALIGEKTGLKDKLDQAAGEVGQLESSIADYIKRYQLFGDKEKCISLEDLKEKIEELKKEQEETEPEIAELEKDLKAEEAKEEQLEAETKEVEKQIEEEAEKAEELAQEEEAIKETFGKEMELEPVTVEEWSESFEVSRPYWDAVFHPDDEVVEGYKGRYFQVRLKDAEKNVKLLFGPGEYFMDKSDFRDNYGSTIGAFVTEALHSLKKADKGKVKLFVQGSADIVGQNTFKGNLDNRFMYSEVKVLPQKEGSDSFESTPANKSIPATSFRNTDLPDLRGNFLKEMISIYSKKLDPILLEGKVKEVANKGDRNAVIYLFIPEELVEE